MILKLDIAKKEFVLEKMQTFLWNAFCDADGVGVNLDTFLSWTGLHLTSQEIESVTMHYYGEGEWSKNDEKISGIVADTTECEDFDWLYDWLVWSVGDKTAAELMENWANEDWAD